jgi:hypothetical protein
MKLAIGAVYSVFSRNGCVVSFSDGTECLSVPAEEVRLLLAQEEEMEVSDPAAIVSVVPNGAEVLHGVMMSGYSADKLPAGYTRVDFVLKDDLLGDSFLIKETFTGRVGVQLTAFKYKSWGGQAQRLGVHETCYLEMGSSTSLTVGVNGKPLLTLPTVADTRLLWRAFYRGSDEVVLTTEEGEVSGSSTYKFTPSSLGLFGCPYGSSIGYTGRGRIYELRVSEDANEKYIFKPCVSPDGSILLCCVKTGKLIEPVQVGKRNRAGLTATQTVTLCRNLSSAGGELRIVLPEGYEQNERVVESLTQAESKGWVLTIQTYAAETAAATFAIRRVWCRRSQDENGSYVASDGTRWLVEWCVDVIGADPESLGYERYRSVDAAVAYWELTPYVDPNAEELSNVE